MMASARSAFASIFRGWSGRNAEEYAHALQFRVELAREPTVARPRRRVPELRLERAILQREISPANHAIAPEQRKRVVAALPFRRRRVRLEPVGPAPEQFEAATIPH